MLPAPVPSRSVGLPANPRPQRTMRNSHNAPTDLPPASSASTHPGYTTPSPPSLHARSRSQPPRSVSSPRHSHSASATTRAHETSDLYNPKLRDRGQARARTPLLETFDDKPSSEKYLRPPSPAPLSTEDLPAYETPYVRPATRKATIDESSGDGYAIWNAVSSVASALTVSVSKAWSANITTFSGEETPPGQESRLTRAMKAYHIAQARSPSDLPDWLFDERERRAANASLGSDDIPVELQPPMQSNIRQNTASGERLTSTLISTESTSVQPQLRGTDRLKAMREAKRRFEERDASEFPGTINQQANTSSYAPQSVTQPRIGLPSRPQRGRR